MTCTKCNDLGLEPVLEHVSYPGHAPGEKHTEIENFDLLRKPRAWEEDGTVHRLYRSYRLCDCPAAMARRNDKPHGKKSRNPLD